MTWLWSVVSDKHIHTFISLDVTGAVQILQLAMQQVRYEMPFSQKLIHFDKNLWWTYYRMLSIKFFLGTFDYLYQILHKFLPCWVVDTMPGLEVYFYIQSIPHDLLHSLYAGLIANSIIGTCDHKMDGKCLFGFWCPTARIISNTFPDVLAWSTIKEVTVT